LVTTAAFLKQVYFTKSANPTHAKDLGIRELSVQ